MAKSTYQTIKIFGLDVFSSDYAGLLTLLLTHLQTNKSLLTIMTPNPEQIVLSRRDQTFLDHLQSADILIPDGIGLVIASNLLTTRQSGAINERITGRQLAADLLALAGQHSFSVLVVGGQHYSLDEHASEGELSVLSSDKSQAHVYWTQGYADVHHPSEKEEAALISLIEKKKPAIIFVAFGAPFQEAWLVQHRVELEKAGVQLAMAVGGAFDMLLGKISPAPRTMQRLGLEWLYRLYREPWRWRRQLQLLVFIKLVIQQWLAGK